jgi:hypothetical protein
MKKQYSTNQQPYIYKDNQYQNYQLITRIINQLPEYLPITIDNVWRFWGVHNISALITLNTLLNGIWHLCHGPTLYIQISLHICAVYESWPGSKLVYL